MKSQICDSCGIALYFFLNYPNVQANLYDQGFPYGSECVLNQKCRLCGKFRQVLTSEELEEAYAKALEKDPKRAEFEACEE